jgi:hypothetical protein
LESDGVETNIKDLVSTGMAESLDNVKLPLASGEMSETGNGQELRHSKRKRTENKLYNTRSFWRHNANNLSPMEGFLAPFLGFLQTPTHSPPQVIEGKIIIFYVISNISISRAPS